MSGYEGPDPKVTTGEGLREVQRHGFFVGDWIAALTRKPTCAVCGREFQRGDKGLFAFHVSLGKPVRLCAKCGQSQAEEEDRLLAEARAKKH